MYVCCLGCVVICIQIYFFVCSLGQAVFALFFLCSFLGGSMLMATQSNFFIAKMQYGVSLSPTVVPCPVSLIIKTQFKVNSEVSFASHLRSTLPQSTRNRRFPHLPQLIASTISLAIYLKPKVVYISYGSQIMTQPKC